MWTATKIELKENHKKAEYFSDGFTLIINDEWISNEITSDKKMQETISFQSCVCNYCGHVGCNAGGILTAAYDGDKLLFIPAFMDMDEYEEYSSGNGDGDSECPPHKWFTHGILIVEGGFLKELLSTVSGLEKGVVRDITEEQKREIEVWEKLVIEQPQGFMNDFYKE